MSRSNFATIFLASAGVGFVALLLSLGLPAVNGRSGARLPDDDDDFSLRSFLVVFREPALLPWYAVTVVNMFFVGILFGFLPVRAHPFGLSATTSGLLLSAVSLAYLILQPLAGSVADRSSPGFTIRLGLLLSGISVIAIPFVHGTALIATAVVAGLRSRRSRG